MMEVLASIRVSYAASVSLFVRAVSASTHSASGSAQPELPLEVVARILATSVQAEEPLVRLTPARKGVVSGHEPMFLSQFPGTGRAGVLFKFHDAMDTFEFSVRSPMITFSLR